MGVQLAIKLTPALAYSYPTFSFYETVVKKMNTKVNVLMVIKN